MGDQNSRVRLLCEAAGLQPDPDDIPLLARALESHQQMMDELRAADGFIPLGPSA